jgi:8-oxo-dGTP pyrophosphatase MutT (NUDIX family)
MPKPAKVAAGGLVERSMSERTVLALVRRTRYGDWVLPKGKSDGDETLEETALREVREETGCEARITGPGYTIEYLVGRVPKVVTFFRMQYLREDLRSIRRRFRKWSGSRRRPRSGA